MNFACFEFINTQWTITHPPYKDRLEDKEWLDGFLNRFDLPRHPDPLPHQELEEFKALRAVLSAAVDTIEKGGELGEDQLETINKYARKVPLYYELKKEDGKYKAKLKPAALGRDYLLHAIAASFMQVLSQYDVQRIKKCGNPACGWVLYDVSKNITRRWCSNTCSSLIKVRRFRQKQKTRGKDPLKKNSNQPEDGLRES